MNTATQTAPATIVNKKGNTGYLVGQWNTDIGSWNNKNSASRPSHRAERGQEFTADDSIKVIIHQVEVHSCGKKQMLLKCEDDFNGFKGQQYNPETPIYATLEDAKQAARLRYLEGMARTIVNLEDFIAKWGNPAEVEAHDAKFNSRTSSAKHFADRVATSQEFLDEINAGRWPLGLVEWTKHHAHVDAGGEWNSYQAEISINCK